MNNNGIPPEIVMPEPHIPYHISEGTNSKIYNVYLNEEIGEAHEYSKLFNLFRNVSEYDYIRMYINSPGGNLFTGVQLINAMKGSAANIITVLDGMAFSLAPLILFAGDEISINENSMIMFHHYSSFGGGKGNEQLSNSKAMNKFYRSILIKYGVPFLNENEIDQILDGKDFYFGDDEIGKRIDRINEMNEAAEDDDVIPEEGLQLELELEVKD